MRWLSAHSASRCSKWDLTINKISLCGKHGSNPLPHTLYKGITLGPGNRMLIIERVIEEDEGLYRCQATNRKGFVETSAYITVQGKCRK